MNHNSPPCYQSKFFMIASPPAFFLSQHTVGYIHQLLAVLELYVGYDLSTHICQIVIRAYFKNLNFSRFKYLIQNATSYCALSSHGKLGILTSTTLRLSECTTINFLNAKFFHESFHPFLFH